MPDARANFFDRIAALGNALNHESIVAGPPAEIVENARARITRNGLAVIGFTIVEDFFRARAQEVLARIGRSGVGFDRLPSGLRRMSTIRAMKAAMFQLNIKDAQRDDIAYVQDKARSVASTLSSSFEISELSFGYESSNISDSMISEFLEALQVEKPWENIGQVAARAGVGTLSQRHKAAFVELSDRRHRAAHDPRADLQPGELQSGLIDTIGLAIGFDALLSVVGQRFHRQDKDFLSKNTKVGYKDVPMVL